MPRVVHFEIGADDPARAASFYTGLFGWQFQPWPGPIEYWLVTTGPKDEPGIDGGMFIRKGSVGHVNTVDVPDLESTLARVRELGGEVVLPRTAIPAVGYNAYCKDTEGNIFGVFQADPHAGE